jgi:hypothetical protein
MDPKLHNPKLALGRWARLLADLLWKRTLNDREYARSVRESLSRQPFLKSGGLDLTREEAHDRESFS